MTDPAETAGGQTKTAHELVMSIVERPVYLRDVVKESVLGGHTFERMQLGDFVLQLLLETSEFRERAASYRDFSVAAGAWCIGSGGLYGRTLGYNVKLDETDLVNIHAEDQVVAKAEQAGFGAISVLAIIGPPQEDHASGKLTETLHPCGRCRGRLGESPLVSKDTLIVTAQPDFTVIQFASLSAIIAAHQGEPNPGITTFTFPETPAILQPRDFPSEWELASGRVEPRTVPEIDSRDFDSTIGMYLLQRYQSHVESAGL